MTPGVGKHLLLDFVQSLGDANCHLALISDCDLCPTDATFTGQGEIRAQGYAAGGKKLQGFSSGLDDGIAWANWQNVEWQNASIRAAGAVIYAKDWGNRIITIVDFGEEQRSSQGMFRVKMPAPGPSNAVFWLA